MLGEGRAVPMRLAGELGDGRFRFEGAIPASETGEHAFLAKVEAIDAGIKAGGNEPPSHLGVGERPVLGFGALGT